MLQEGRNRAMRRRPSVLLLILTCVFASGLYFARDMLAWPEWPLATNRRADSESDFDRWLAETPERGAAFGEFEALLRTEGVDDVVPAWQLTRIDSFYSGRCDLDPFAIPPRELWPRIVPALRLVREHVVAEVGPVEVLSAFRTPAINTCVNGARSSKHLAFAALDLATVDRRRSGELYRKLCDMQQRAGPASRMGLGAYFDPAEPERSSGRFHIDGEGFRTWGRDYTSRSNPCPLFEHEGAQA